MQAVVCPKYGAPEVLQLTEVKKPIPQDHEVLIKTHATTVTVADYRVRSFKVPASVWLPARIAVGLTKPKKPILGIELAGEVEAVGKKVTRFKKGDQVLAATLRSFGGYAQYKCLPEDGPIALKPPTMTYGEAAALPIGARTALHFLKKAKIAAGQKVLIYGASGSVGTYAVQLAKYFGAEVTGVCSKDNFSLVKSLGADRVLNYKAPDFIRQLEVYDIIFLAVDKFPFAICKNFLEEKGVYVNVTSPIKSGQMLWTSLTTQKKIIMAENPPESSEDLAFLKSLVENKQLTAVIDRSYTLGEIVEAHRYVERGHKKGNVVVNIA